MEIGATLKGGACDATSEELKGIDRGLKAAREGRFASDEEVEAVFAKYRQGAQRVVQRSGVHVAPLIQSAYKLFYLINDNTLEILHIHHSARRAPWEDRV
jgi:hypothetical protein